MIPNVKDTDTSTPLIQAFRDVRSEQPSIVPSWIFSKQELDTLIKNVEKNEEVASIRVKKVIGGGSSARVVFETESGDVLKITEENHFPLRRPHESFDVPIFKQGKAGSLYFYIEEKLYQHGLGDGFVEIVRDMIRKCGYVPNDLETGAVHQIGISQEGKLYLLDPECARYKTVFHALFDKALRFMRKAIRI